MVKFGSDWLRLFAPIKAVNYVEATPQCACSASGLNQQLVVPARPQGDPKHICEARSPSAFGRATPLLPL